MKPNAKHAHTQWNNEEGTVITNWRRYLTHIIQLLYKSRP